jgi:hypothetical protein
VKGDKGDPGPQGVAGPPGPAGAPYQSQNAIYFPNDLIYSGSWVPRAEITLTTHGRPVFVSAYIDAGTGSDCGGVLQPRIFVWHNGVWREITANGPMRVTNPWTYTTASGIYAHLPAGTWTFKLRIDHGCVGYCVGNGWISAWEY